MVTTVDLDALIARVHAAGVGLVGEPIRTPLPQWPWLHSCLGWYDEGEILHWLFCLAVYSNQAAHRLYRSRALAVERVRSGAAEAIPLNEAAVPTELRKAGFRLMTLREFGSTGYYDTSPPYPEDMLADLQHEAFIHPVLDTSRFVAKLLGDVREPPELLRDDHPYRRRVGDRAFVPVLPQLHHRLYAAGDDDGCRRVIGLIRQWGRTRYLRLHGLDGSNIALGKPATQSSISEWSLRPDEANGAVAGPVSGFYTFHTAWEERPWWMVDLLVPQPVTSVRVFNRMDIPERANGLEVYVSADGRRWELAGQHEGDAPFGGADGHPLEVGRGTDGPFRACGASARGSVAPRSGCRCCGDGR